MGAVQGFARRWAPRGGRCGAGRRAGSLGPSWTRAPRGEVAVSHAGMSGWNDCIRGSSATCSTSTAISKADKL